MFCLTSHISGKKDYLYNFHRNVNVCELACLSVTFHGSTPILVVKCEDPGDGQRQLLRKT